MSLELTEARRTLRVTRVQRAPEVRPPDVATPSPLPLAPPAFSDSAMIGLVLLVIAVAVGVVLIAVLLVIVAVAGAAVLL